MGIFSIFTLKADIKKVFTAENFAKLRAYIEQQIVGYVNNSNMLGTEKKAEVDKAVVAYINEHFKSTNTYVNMLVGLLITFEPTLSQYVYDMLKKFVNGLTAPVS